MLLLAVMATGCHSSEKNYREAYEKAIERRQSGYGAEAYAEIEAERMRNTTVINGDSVRLVYVDTNVALDSSDVAKTYNVVVASFTQQINAKSYRDRLRSECGFPSYILYGGPEKLYFVVVQGFDNKEDAALLLRDIDTKVCLKVMERKPWILRRP
jgi:hypothetical protein